MNKLSKREQIIEKIFDKLQTLSANKTTVYRNLDKPQMVPKNGMVILRDSDAAKEVASFLSPVTHIYELILQLEVIIQDENPIKRFQMVDMLINDIHSIIRENRYLV